MDTNRFNQILVVDSIPTGDSNTAKRLFEDIDTYANAYSPSPSVCYLRIESCDEFIKCLFQCRNDAKEKDIIPLLHIECHGGEDGLQFADGSFADWKELKLPITELNIATGLNLMIAVAACTGGALAKILCISDRAPFWGLIGPTQTLKAIELENAFRTFYLELLSTKSPAKAVQAMDKETMPGLFWRTTSQVLFERVWAGYKKEYCNAEALEMRAKRMRERFIQEPGVPLPSTDELKIRLIKHEPQAFEHFRNIFFMYDLFSEHADRFPVEYVA
jgi:hypothetical protein